MNILNKLTIKHLKMNKKRTIVTIIGVILSTALMVGIGLIFSSIRDNMIKEIISYNGSYHVQYQNMTYKQKSLLENNTNVEKVFYSHELGYASLKEGQNQYKPYLHVLAVNDSYYEELTFISGRKPANSDEIVISDHIKNNGGVTLALGDTIELEIGDRYYPEEDGKTLPIEYGRAYEEGETLQVRTKKTYKIVGIVERSTYESYDEPGYSVFVNIEEINENDPIYSYVIFKSTKNVYKKIYTLADNLGKEKEEYGDSFYYPEIKLNDSLLSLYGQSRYNNINQGMFQIIGIILTIISIGCIVVIYNSFAISVMERKKQFGLFSSIGATKKQLRKTVFFEAFIVAIIGIPLGILGAYLGIGIVIQIVNYLVPGMMGSNLELSTYLPLVLIPVFFMIAVIILSAYLPAKRASKVTPIEAIRQNDDIKIKNKKLKTGKWVRKVFGVEGEIALKNIKRNKKKYRITIASLFISIVMFVSFSSILQYGLRGSEDFFTMPDYNIQIQFYDKDTDKALRFEKEILSYEGVEKAVAYGNRLLNIPVVDPSYYTSDALNFMKTLIENNEVNNETYDYANITYVNQEYYQALLNKYQVSDGTAFLLNRLKGTSYQNGKRLTYDVPFLKKEFSSLTLCNLEYDYEKEVEKVDGGGFEVKNPHCDATLTNIKNIDQIPFGMSTNLDGNTNITILVSDAMYQEINQKLTYQNEKIYYGKEIVIQATNYQPLDKHLKDIEDGNLMYRLSYSNLEEGMKLERNMILVIKILLYGFISLVTLIGVTSVFNTINTSIALRRKEFAMLRSMGLTPGGFNKIICFESLFFGLKSLLYALPFSCLVIIWIHETMGNIVSYSSIIWPWGAFLTAIIGVFLIVFATMIYATQKIKHENILESIREENI